MMSTRGIEGILNYLPISETIGTAGQPTKAQFATIRAAGYEAVVNLAMPDSSNALPDERELVAEQGMDYVHIPVVWDAPSMADLERFFAVMEGYRDRKVFVHCVVNMRVSVFILLYRVLRQGVPLGEARGAMLKIWEPNEVWQSFMEDALAASLSSRLEETSEPWE
jgi:protein tyrosine phosphatase (PTP) superfamily phosphohydrolase (DUF442 family)